MFALRARTTIHTDQPPAITERFGNINAQPGEFVSLRCTSVGSPLAQIEWSVDRLPIANSARFRFGDFVTKSQMLKQDGLFTPSSLPSAVGTEVLVSHFNISSVRVEDGGLYRCMAKNVAGYAYHEARLNVVGKSSVKMHTSNITSVANTDIDLNCPFYGYPIAEINWYGKGKVPGDWTA